MAKKKVYKWRAASFVIRAQGPCHGSILLYVLNRVRWVVVIVDDTFEIVDEASNSWTVITGVISWNVLSIVEIHDFLVSQRATEQVGPVGLSVSSCLRSAQ